jgi:lipid II:glycine glycyltransferase (peptidoglycan interpeptide bridge formation enzyme)
VSDFSNSAVGSRFVCLRIPVSAFVDGESIPAPSVVTPETAITDLGSWDLMAVSKKLRRDIRKANRSGLEISRGVNAALGPVLYDMYRQTVMHHGGSLRYTQDYFSALSALAGENPAIRLYTARADGDPVGFAVTVQDRETCYYLHGGSLPHARQSSPSDMMLADAIADAREAGSSTFNFMSSPADQPSLVRYKEKWGGETRSQRTYTLRLSPAYPIFRVAEKAYSLIS